MSNLISAMSSESATGTASSFFSTASPRHSSHAPDSPYRATSTDSLRPHIAFPERKSSLKHKDEGRLPPADFQITESEFESLPPAIRRKYFSTLERLRLAHHVPSPMPPQKTIHFPKPSAPPRLLVDTLAANAAPKSSTLRRKSKKTKRASITQADAQWYLQLPEKVRRKQFSREEQVMLAGTSETVILDPADEALYKLGKRGNRSFPEVSPAGESPTRRPTSSSSLGTKSAGHSNTDLPGGQSQGSTDREMISPDEDWFRWMEDEEDESPMNRDSYHANIVSDDTVPPLPANGHARRPSFRRGPSLDLKPFAPLSVPADITNPSPMQTKEREPVHGHAQKPSLNLSNAAVRPNAKAAALTGDPEAKYYQDPEARLKLRMYLGSAQKFDEALEFGFPSIEGANVEISKRERVKAEKRKSGGNEAQTFLNDDDGFLFDDDDSSSSVADVDEPPTPSEIDVTFRAPHHRTSDTPNPHSSDSFGHAEKLLGGRPKPILDPYAQAFAGDREMTLRMTLTKPELRADEEKPGISHQPRPVPRAKPDPLMLGELPPLTEDATGMRGPFTGPDGWGPLPKREGTLKKIWKKVRHGPR